MQNGFDITVTGVDFVVERTYPGDTGYTVKDRSSCRLVSVLDGRAIHNFSNQSVPTEKGDILFLPPHNDHTVSIGEDGYRFITVSFPILPIDIPPAFFPIAKLCDAGLFSHFFEMYRAFEAKETGYLSEIKAHIYTLLHAIISENLQIGGGVDKMQKTVSYIKKNYAEPLSLEILAGVSGYSVPHFKKLFADELGVSPIRYLNEFRIGRAKDLLASGLFSIKEIATACGFDNVYYFSNTFKKKTGLTPLGYVRALKK
jgi:AraC-like DNA-binding protein